MINYLNAINNIRDIDCEWTYENFKAWHYESMTNILLITEKTRRYRFSIQTGRSLTEGHSIDLSCYYAKGFEA